MRDIDYILVSKYLNKCIDCMINMLFVKTGWYRNNFIYMQCNTFWEKTTQKHPYLCQHFSIYLCKLSMYKHGNLVQQRPLFIPHSVSEMQQKSKRFKAGKYFSYKNI